MVRKILMIDDDANIVRVVGSRLKANGYDFISAATGAEGIDRAKAEQPDLIIMDITMPGMSGYEAIGRLKQDDQTKAIPVVMLSARHDIEDIVKSMSDSCGAVDFCPKPFTAAELLLKIDRALRIFGKEGGG
ncbi:MAG: response regulator [Candidatus Omnitrophica bacterium]|nr:response regulator [Candidatus Omnitrophota bacterium]